MFKLFKPFSLFIGVRYTNLKRRDTFITFISLISMIGIALSIMVLITVLSVMNGFSKEIRSKILSVTPHLTVSAFHNDDLKNWPILSKKIEQHPQIEASTPYIDGQGMIMHEGEVRGVLVRGILPAQVDKVFPLEQSLIAGNLQDLYPGAFGVLIGKPLAQQFNWAIGDYVTLVVPQVQISLAGANPRLKRLKIVGIFDAGLAYDGSLLFLNLQDASKIFHTNEGITGIQAKLKDPFASTQIRKEIKQALDNQYYVVDWTMLNSNYFSAVKMEKTMMFFTLMLILAIAVFNLISTLVMIVTDKRPDIAILRTLGASRSKIMGIFIWQGAIIGIIGTASGVLLGVLLSLNVTRIVDLIQKTFQVQFLSEDIYFLSFLPSQLLLSDVLLIAGCSLVLSFLATIHPAWRASNILPAEALRYDQ